MATVYLFKLTNPASSWTLDLKLNKVGAGETAKPECTLELTDADFMAMTEGKANAMKLFTSGALKIAGNVMASQKLDFLTKVDRKAVESAAAAAPAKAPEAAPAAGAASSPAKAPAIFEALAAKFAAHPALAGEWGVLAQFDVASPEGHWVVDGTVTPATVTAGRNAAATSRLALSDDDLASLAAGTGDARKMFQHGALRVDGDVSVAHRLHLLKK